MLNYTNDSMYGVNNFATSSNNQYDIGSNLVHNRYTDLRSMDSSNLNLNSNSDCHGIIAQNIDFYGLQCLNDSSFNLRCNKYNDNNQYSFSNTQNQSVNNAFRNICDMKPNHSLSSISTTNSLKNNNSNQNNDNEQHESQTSNAFNRLPILPPLPSRRQIKQNIIDCTEIDIPTNTQNHQFHDQSVPNINTNPPSIYNNNNDQKQLNGWNSPNTTQSSTGSYSLICDDSVCQVNPSCAIHGAHVINNNNMENNMNNNNMNNSNTSFECAVCSELCPSHDILVHATRYHKKICGFCGKKFARNSNLKEHIRIHTGFTPYVCNICQRGFKQQHSLKDHVRTHTGEKPFPCTVCNKRFAVKNNLKVHLRVHSGEKPYQCSICYKQFTQKGSLNTHLRKVHKQIIQSKRKTNKNNK